MKNPNAHTPCLYIFCFVLVVMIINAIVIRFSKMARGFWPASKRLPNAISPPPHPSANRQNFLTNSGQIKKWDQLVCVLAYDDNTLMMKWRAEKRKQQQQQRPQQHLTFEPINESNVHTKIGVYTTVRSDYTCICGAQNRYLIIQIRGN